tara:strand:- start:24 stop:380 length:357 start_codon:yes stop_codon:yes gene_type:complete
MLDHPILELLAIKARQARDVAASSTKVDKEASSEIKVIMAELDSKEVIVGELKIILSETKRENSKLFKEALLKAGVSPAILEAAAEASKTSSETLNIKAAPQEEVLAPMSSGEGVSFY